MVQVSRGIQWIQMEMVSGFDHFLPYFAIEMLVNVCYLNIYQVISHIGMLPRFCVGIYKSKLKLCFLPGHL
jgi:hypothetical protein